MRQFSACHHQEDRLVVIPKTMDAIPASYSELDSPKRGRGELDYQVHVLKASIVQGRTKRSCTNPVHGHKGELKFVLTVMHLLSMSVSQVAGMVAGRYGRGLGIQELRGGS